MSEWEEVGLYGYKGILKLFSIGMYPNIDIFDHTTHMLVSAGCGSRYRSGDRFSSSNTLTSVSVP